MAVEIEDAFLIAIHTYAYRTMAFEDGGISKIVGVVFAHHQGANNGCATKSSSMMGI